MLDGVEWAAAEIVFYMLLATLIGFAIAYVFIRWFQRGSIADSFEAELAAQQELARKAEYRLIESNDALDKVHLELKGEQQRVGSLQAELEIARTALKELEAAAPDEAEVAQLEADLESSRGEVAQLQVDLESSRREVAQLEVDLESSVRWRSLRWIWSRVGVRWRSLRWIWSRVGVRWRSFRWIWSRVGVKQPMPQGEVPN
jgi:uncharacterized protein YlxW (UPF0749 family)